MLIQNLNLEELQELLMEETKRFTAALHNGTPQIEKNKIRDRIDNIVELIEEKQHKNDRTSSTPETAH